ncbi:ImmA/IrrE family metallo-endopeptidase [Thermoanaerobacterium sp. DL9XJH110]|uniref:ImmA/IrrE family metallo-endopeptidase n=1 Tax=Thermoanaerobacterium sp. DL9XJH110 TaxID=3386643 RepID=UPI003BB5FA18
MGKINYRHDYVHDKIADFIVEFDIKKLPVEPLEIINKKKWTLRTYEFYARKHKVKIKDIIEAYGSEDAFTIYKNGLYSIAYNDKIRSSGRIRFTLMHEIGHIYLKHLEEFNHTILSRGGLNKKEYEMLEKEANIFASEILSPYSVLLTLKWTNYELIKKYCGLSIHAAKTRASQLFDLRINRIYIDEGSIIYRNFFDFINQKYCPVCGYGFISKESVYCPICGNKLKWGEGYMKYREGVPLDENNRALICPRCENEEIDAEDKYCKICGTYLIQECSDNDFKPGCGYKPVSNARFCPMCGNTTTFYDQKLLKDWKKEKEEIEFEQTIDETEVPF